MVKTSSRFVLARFQAREAYLMKWPSLAKYEIRTTRYESVRRETF